MRRKLCVLVPAHWEAIMGGSQYQASLLIDHLLRHYDVDVTYLTTLANERFVPAGYRIVQFSDRRGLRRYGTFFDGPRLYRALKRERPDAILQFVGSAHTGFAALYARLNSCTMWWRVTNDRTVEPERAPWWHLHRQLERAWLNVGIRYCTGVIAQTEYQRRQLAGRVDPERLHVVANFHPAPRDRGERRSHERRVVWVANMKPLKNPGAFLRLAQRFAGSDVRFVMIGRTMDDGEWTRSTLAAIAATPNVEYLGARPQDEVNAVLDTADLLVNTSDYEGFSNAFIQAWLRRVPVVSLLVDPDGLLSTGGLGAWAGSENALFEHVDALLRSPARRAKIGARARAHALAHHAEANIDAMAKLLGLDARSDYRDSRSSSSFRPMASRASSASS